MLEEVNGLLDIYCMSTSIHVKQRKVPRVTSRTFVQGSENGRLRWCGQLPDYWLKQDGEGSLAAVLLFLLLGLPTKATLQQDSGSEGLTRLIDATSIGSTFKLGTLCQLRSPMQMPAFD